MKLGKHRQIFVTVPTFVLIVDWLIQLEDNPLLLLKEFPTDRHQILILCNSHPSCGEINQDIDLGDDNAVDDDGHGNGDNGDGGDGDGYGDDYDDDDGVEKPYPPGLHLVQLLKVKVVEKLLENTQLEEK